MKEKKKYLPLKRSLFIRIGVSLYLMYIVYSMRDVGTKYAGGELSVFVIAIAIFAVISVCMLAHSLKCFFTGYYEGGAQDIKAIEEAQEIQEAHEIEEAQEIHKTQDMP